MLSWTPPIYVFVLGASLLPVMFAQLDALVLLCLVLPPPPPFLISLFMLYICAVDCCQSLSVTL